MKTNIVMIVDCDKSRKSSRREEVGCIVIKDEGPGSLGKHRKNRRNEPLVRSEVTPSFLTLYFRVSFLVSEPSPNDSQHNCQLLTVMFFFH